MDSGFILYESVQDCTGMYLEKETETEESRIETPIGVSCPSTSDGPPFSTIIDDLNARAGTSFKEDSKASRKLIRARWAEGHRLEDFREVHKRMVTAWRNTNMEQYLRPSTLYRATKYENYLNYRVQDIDPKVTGSCADDISF